MRCGGGLNPPPYEKTQAGVAPFEPARQIAAGIGIDLQDVLSGSGSDANFTAATRPSLDGLGVDGEGAHTDHQQLYISSLVPPSELFSRLIRTRLSS